MEAEVEMLGLSALQTRWGRPKSKVQRPQVVACARGRVSWGLTHPVPDQDFVRSALVCGALQLEKDPVRDHNAFWEGDQSRQHT